MNRNTAHVTCRNCGSNFRGERNEDGAPEIPDQVKCAIDWCQTYLCPEGCDHLSFVCTGCNHRVCGAHPEMRQGGERFCVTCMAEIRKLNPTTPFDLPEVA